MEEKDRIQLDACDRLKKVQADLLAKGLKAPAAALDTAIMAVCGKTPV